MTDNQTSDESQGELDPITALAKELDALKSELSDIKTSYSKLAADNSALLESNRKLLGELGKMVSPPEVKPPEKTAADIAYESFIRTIGIER
jgi:regulator of replication initiation timing